MAANRPRKGLNDSFGELQRRHKAAAAERRARAQTKARARD
ncbi:hypothetical protein [Streptomyces sp. NPDC002889]